MKVSVWSKFTVVCVSNGSMLYAWWDAFLCTTAELLHLPSSSKQPGPQNIFVCISQTVVYEIPRRLETIQISSNQTNQSHASIWSKSLKSHRYLKWTLILYLYDFCDVLLHMMGWYWLVVPNKVDGERILHWNKSRLCNVNHLLNEH